MSVVMQEVDVRRLSLPVKTEAVSSPVRDVTDATTVRTAAMSSTAVIQQLSLSLFSCIVRYTLHEFTDLYSCAAEAECSGRV